MLTVHERGEHGSTGLFQLEEQDVLVMGADQERHECPEPDRTHAHDLVCDVEQGVAADDATPLGGECREVVVQTLRERLELGRGDTGDERRLLDDPALSGLGRREAGECAVRRPPPCGAGSASARSSTVLAWATSSMAR
jgi:hypothetical protein